MRLDDPKVESAYPIEKSLIGSKPRGIFDLIAVLPLGVQDLSDRRGCFCHSRELLSVNLIYYMTTLHIQVGNIKYLYNKLKLFVKGLKALAKATEKPAYPPGLKSQRLAAGSSCVNLSWNMLKTINHLLHSHKLVASLLQIRNDNRESSYSRASVATTIMQE